MSGEYTINPLEPKAWTDSVEDIDATTPEAFKKVTRLSQHIAFLKDLKGKMVKSIVISLNEVQLQFSGIMLEQLKAKSDTKCSLVFKIHDLETNRYVEMQSKYKIPLTREFIEQLDELGIKYKVEV